MRPDKRGVVDYAPKPAQFFPEGKDTFWVGLFVDGYASLSFADHLNRRFIDVCTSCMSGHVSGCCPDRFCRLLVHMTLIRGCRFGPGQGSRSLGLVGIYCCFLALDLKVMRRAENIGIVSIFSNTACLQQVTRLVAAQFVELAKGIHVLDLTQAVPESEADGKNAEKFVRASDGQLVPFKRVVCRCAYSLGDSPNQVELGGGRTVNTTFFCSRCHTNKPTVGYASTIHKFKEQILNYDISMYL